LQFKQRWTSIGKNSIVKNMENFSARNTKTSPENSLPLPTNRKKRKDFTQ